MLYLISGKDYSAIKKETNSIVSLFSKNSVPNIERHTELTINAKDLAYRAEGNSLFGTQTIYILDSLIEKESEEILDILEMLSQSKNVFIFCEDDIKKDIEKEFTSAHATVKIIKSEAKEKENPFAITDALLAKDKKKTWLLYRREIEKGESAEAILGRFVWAIKTLVLVTKYPNATAASLGIAPFVYSKTKSVGRAWGPGEPEKFYTKMLFDLKPGGEMEYHLEKIILEL